MPQGPSRSATSRPAEAQLKGFIAKFSPQNQRLIRRLRASLRRRLPAANELVYDNYNFLVIAYSPTERPSDSCCSIGADKHGANLFFGYNGTRLPDPQKLLRGSGALNRFIRLETAEAIEAPGVKALIDAAIGVSRPMSEERGRLIIRAVSPKHRSRR